MQKTARRKHTGCLNAQLCYGRWDFREVTTVYVAGTRPRTSSFCCFRNNFRFQKFFRGTDGYVYKFLLSIFDKKGMFGPKFFGIIFFSQ